MSSVGSSTLDYSISGIQSTFQIFLVVKYTKQWLRCPSSAALWRRPLARHQQNGFPFCTCDSAAVFAVLLSLRCCCCCCSKPQPQPTMFGGKRAGYRLGEQEASFFLLFAPPRTKTAPVISPCPGFYLQKESERTQIKTLIFSRKIY